ncbi:MAG: lipoate--protein ligase A [Pirellulaceae bacterium]|nr:MAG: lipoate--protein ligase A [Pirellulaceae bacterium]
MQILELTLDNPAANVALDEALLDAAEAGELEDDEVLRLWESPNYLIVVGRSSCIAKEIDLEATQKKGVPILRRCSGGAAIVAGPGCLMYAVVLSYNNRPQLHDLGIAHQFVLGRLAAAVEKQLPNVSICGTSDLAWRGRKFSGNSMRCKRHHLLYHGTILYNMDISLIESLLRMPPRQPDYRRQRTHDEFVTNVPLNIDQLRRDLCVVWRIDAHLENWPRQRTSELVEQQYGRPEWIYRF